jgi:hypothetical protein
MRFGMVGLPRIWIEEIVFLDDQAHVLGHSVVVYVDGVVQHFCGCYCMVWLWSSCLVLILACDDV